MPKAPPPLAYPKIFTVSSGKESLIVATDAMYVKLQLHPVNSNVMKSTLKDKIVFNH